MTKMFFGPEKKQQTTEVEQISMSMKFFIGLQGFLASYQPDLDPNQLEQSQFQKLNFTSATKLY